jgi:hypothetical protein
MASAGPGLGWKSSSPIFGSKSSRSGRATSRSAGRTPAAGLRPAHPRPLGRRLPGHRSARSDQHLSETCRVVDNDGGRRSAPTQQHAGRRGRAGSTSCGPCNETTPATNPECRAPLDNLIETHSDASWCQAVESGVSMLQVHAVDTEAVKLRELGELASLLLPRLISETGGFAKRGVRRSRRPQRWFADRHPDRRLSHGRHRCAVDRSSGCQPKRAGLPSRRTCSCPST